jgi:hypothetical protein
MRLRDFAFVADLKCKKKKKSPSAESNLPPPARIVRRSAHCANAAAGCRDDRRPMPLRVAVVTCVRTDVFERTRFSTLAEIVDNFRTPSPIFAIFFCSVSPTRRAPYCREFRASVPRRRRVRRRPASIGLFVASRPTGGPARTSPASEPLFRSGRNFLAWWPTRRRVRPPSFVALRRRRPVRRRFRTLPPNRPVFDFFPPFFEPDFSPDGPRSTPIAPTRRSPPAASVGRRFDRCRRWFFRTVVEKRRFRPFFRDFPIFFPPPTGPCASEMKAAWHRDAPRPPASAAGSPVLYSVGNFCGGRKTAFRRLWGLPPNPPFRHPLRVSIFVPPPSAESDGEDRVRIGPRLAILPLGSRRVPDILLRYKNSGYCHGGAP